MLNAVTGMAALLALMSDKHGRPGWKACAERGCDGSADGGHARGLTGCSILRSHMPHDSGLRALKFLFKAAGDEVVKSGPSHQWQCAGDAAVLQVFHPQSLLRVRNHEWRSQK